MLIVYNLLLFSNKEVYEVHQGVVTNYVFRPDFCYFIPESKLYFPKILILKINK